MSKFLKDLTVDFAHIPNDQLTADWTWLIGQDKTPIMISITGDMFVKDTIDRVYWLETGLGQFILVANSTMEFQQKLLNSEQINEWFMVEVANALIDSSGKLKAGELYSLVKPLVLGGDYTPENYKATDIEVHFSFAGQLHKGIKDLPEGTKVNIKFEP